MIQGTENKNEQEKKFDFEEASTKWKEKVLEIFPLHSFSVLYAREHPTLKENYVFDFEIRCLHCGGKRQYQWLISKTKICI